DSTGSIDISVSGGTIGSGYTYEWTTVDGSGLVADAEDQTGLTSGTYFLTVTDGNLCEKKYNDGNGIEVTEANPIIIGNPADIQDVTCNGDGDGSITLSNITGGSGSYTFIWTNLTTSVTTDTGNISSISGLIPANYEVKIEDDNGCYLEETYTITQPDVLTITTDSIVLTDCDGENGEIYVSVSGGTQPYKYVWTTTYGTGLEASDEYQTGLTPGTYYLTVTDDNDCKVDASFFLPDTSQLAINYVGQSNVLCYNYSTGSISMNISGGIPFEPSTGVYEWKYSLVGSGGYTGAGTSESDLILNNLPAQTYDITITDSLGCTTDYTDIVITQPDKIIVDDPVILPISCNGEEDGSITIPSVTGGSGTYYYDWYTGSIIDDAFKIDNETSNNINDFAPGIYSVVITDSYGCYVPFYNLEIGDVTFSYLPITTDIPTCELSSGTIDLNINPGTSWSDITIVWDDDPTAGEIRTDLPVGLYYVTITNDQYPDCTIRNTVPFTIGHILQGVEVKELSVNDADDCSIVASGSISIQINYGTSPFDIKWKYNGTDAPAYDIVDTNDLTQSVTGLAPGVYTVTVTDFSGCDSTINIEIERPDDLSMVFDREIVVDCGTYYVYEDVTAQGNGGTGPYTYEWIGLGVYDENRMFTTEGSYTLEITDIRGCTYEDSVTVDLPEISPADFDFTSATYEKFNYYTINDPVYFTNNSEGDITKITW
ncbi:MAG: hypothetical protein GY787_14770, partial [Alteromonadales bacterium]|nr:hypothetical protein [Alteromonadales bacterium]